MSRWEFMRQLEELLSDISPSEREEALQYYNDYINDAGRENEAEVIRSLGSPEQVARIVKEGLGEGQTGEFTENGFSSQTSETANALVKRTETASGQRSEDTSHAAPETVYQEPKQEKEKMPAWAIILIVIGCVLLSPAFIGVVVAALSAIASILLAVLGCVVGAAAASVVLFIVAVALIISGFGSIVAHPLAGMGLLGSGLICGAIGILFLMLTVFLVGICLPGICRGIAYIFKKLFGKKEVA